MGNRATPLAIVDGTYLCLLPTSINDDKDVLHYVPALPCTEVWKHCGQRTVNVNEMTTSMQTDDDNEDNGENANHDNLLSDMETIPIHLSDISRLDFRFVHPVNLLTNTNITQGSSSSVVQISSCSENNIMSDERIAWSNDKNNYLEVYLPSMSFDDEGEHDFQCFEDGGFDVYGDTSCIDYSSHKIHQDNKQSSSSFQVHGGGSCLIADFTSIGGYEQALILPQVDSCLLEEDVSLKDRNDESLLTQRKRLLQTILANSILTDGTSAFLSQNADIRVAADPMGTTIFKLTPINRGLLSQCSPKQSAVTSQSKNKDVDINSHNEETKVNDNLTTDSSTPIPPENPEWLKAIEQTIESRLAKQVAKTKQLERTTQVRSDLIHKGLETIHKAARLHSTTDGSVDISNEPQILRLRYGTRPRTFSDTQNGLSAVIDLEADICLPSKHESEAIHDFHLSCTLVSTVGPSVDNVRTSSGVVREFQNGDCITILASISLSDLDVDAQSSSGSASTLDLNIQGLWLDKLQKRQGSVLCILRLPLDGILFSPIASATRAGHCIQHEIDFTSADESEALAPSAVFDYRHPRTINVDVSGSIGLQDGRIWKDLVSRLNSQIGMGSFIDLYFVKGDPTLKVVIFASNPAERAAITNLVLQNLPENAKLIEQDPNEAKNVKALLESLKSEAEAFQRHRKMSKGKATSEMRKEMSSLQASTDGIASTIKRGWI